MRLLSLASTLLFALPILAQEPAVETLTVIPGTLQPLEPPNMGYFFQTKTGTRQIFEIDRVNFLGGGGVVSGIPTGIPKVKEIGFRLTSGKERLFERLA